MSSVVIVLVDENPNVATAGLGGAAFGGTRRVPYGRTLELKTSRPSACVGKRFSLSGCLE
jgi:hypothetical protein